jgi:tripartite-type tricarboxylate transporter receptor subunit TctC
MITLRALLTVLALVAGGPAAADEVYPTRPVTTIVPFPPGGIAGLTARPLAAALERGFKQPVVVSNKAGAAGAVGMQSVATARPDGYTLLLGLVSISIIPEVDALFGRPPDVEYSLWAGLFAPSGVPAGVLKALREATRQAVADADFKAAMDKAQTPIAYQDADEFKAWWDHDAAMLAPVIKKIGKIEAK